jgi:DNA-binding NtrC family response regulator
MTQNIANTTIHEGPGSGQSDRDGYVFTQPRHARRFSQSMSPLCALVVSSDEMVQQNLAVTIAQCGLLVFRAFTVGESKRILNRWKICLVVCDDRLIDGKYEDLLKATEISRTKAPVIVVSLAGDWPEYFQAVSAGVFDFLAYPPIPGELPRVVRHALQSQVLRSFEEAETKDSKYLAGGAL